MLSREDINICLEQLEQIKKDKINVKKFFATDFDKQSNFLHNPQEKEKTLQKLVSAYRDLLILQYRNKPKAKDTIQMITRAAIADLIPLDVMYGFDLDTGVGKQLDMLGKYIGLNRFVLSVYYSTKYFGTISYSADPHTIDSYGVLAQYPSDGHPAVVGNPVFSYFDNTGTYLNDDDFRILLKLTILKNTINYSTGNIDDLLHTFFPPTSLSNGKDVITMEDTGKMSLIFKVHDPVHAVTFRIAKDLRLLPSPTGVETIVQ